MRRSKDRVDLQHVRALVIEVSSEVVDDLQRPQASAAARNLPKRQRSRVQGWMMGAVARYSVNQHTVDTILGFVKAGQFAIPEMQRPFVWNSTKVRDLLDSLYKGYPVGYLITWHSPGVALRDGSTATNQQILIDGQQRVTALRAAVAGLPIVGKDYRKQRITIAFNPLTERFETATPVIRRDPRWIGDVSQLFASTGLLSFVRAYLDENPDVDPGVVEQSIERLVSIKNAAVGVISLAEDLDVETVAEIFIRINSKGVPLSSADFAMSKIATYGERGQNLRKLIDYFCHLSVAPHVYEDIEKNDPDFAGGPYLPKIGWLAKESQDLYDPGYSDVVRVATLAGFGRASAAHLVSLLSGRDPETRTFDEARIAPTYDRLESVLLKVVNQYDFKQFLMTIQSAGYVSASMISSYNALNFAYALHLRLREQDGLSDGDRKRIVRRWFVMSMLTGRHSGSFESTFEQDIRRILDQGADAYLKHIEESELSDSFWDATLPGNLNTSSTRSPYFLVFQAAQVSNGARGFLSKSITVHTMRSAGGAGDIHHLVPRDYLKKNGYPDPADYNQVANFALTETPVNIAISNHAPRDYMATVDAQAEGSPRIIGEISDGEDLARNLSENAVPEMIRETDARTYREFLAERRRLMAAIIRDYYRNL